MSAGGQPVSRGFCFQGSCGIRLRDPLNVVLCRASYGPRRTDAPYVQLGDGKQTGSGPRLISHADHRCVPRVQPRRRLRGFACCLPGPSIGVYAGTLDSGKRLGVVGPEG